MSEDVWILGIHMTKFGKYPDKDVVDLGAAAVSGALADAGEGISMKDMGILAAGNLMGGGGFGQQLQKQVGQTGIPVYNVSNACATGATALRTAIMAVKAGEVDMGMAVGVEKLAGAGLDVFEEEPLPETSPLWELDNVILTPHVAGVTPLYYERTAALFADNLDRYLAGRPLDNRFDPARGY